MNIIRPIIKWAGGKRQLLVQFGPLFPNNLPPVYHEPFLGSGAVFFHLAPAKAFLTDSNVELINFYLVLRESVEELITHLAQHENTQDYYYLLRAADTGQLTTVERASRFLFLNKCGFNGLWRVNKSGRHNVPYGHYKKPNYLNPPALRAASRALQRTTLQGADFTITLEQARAGDFIYLDPPYYPLSATSSFRSYTSSSFTASDQARLADMYRELDRRGCLLMASNSDTTLVRDLYANFNITIVRARRAINCVGSRRGQINELVIRNYD